MTRLMRWSPLAFPFSPMFQLRREVDDLFSRFFGQGSGEPTQSTWSAWSPEVEGGLQDGHYVIRAALPGVDPKDVEVSLTGNLLTIKGQRKAQRESKEDKYFVREMAYGAFERSFTLPEGVDAAKVFAKYGNGMLEIKVPAPLAEAPRKVAIEVEEPKSLKDAA
jgi:HSP20 family protein